MHHLDSVPLLTLPQPILRRIYSNVLGTGGRAQIEVDETGKLSTHKCRLLQICRQVRSDVLEACDDEAAPFHLIYTFRSPAAFANFKHLGLGSLQQKVSVRLVLLGPLEGCQLTQEDRGRDIGPHICPLIKAWREVFKALRAENVPPTIDFLYFDLTRSFDYQFHEGIARLLTLLSLNLQRWSDGETRCQITGCETTCGQSFAENYTVNVTPSPPRCHHQRRRHRKPLE